jgi:hypothetical protein
MDRSIHDSSISVNAQDGFLSDTVVMPDYRRAWYPGGTYFSTVHRKIIGGAHPAIVGMTHCEIP